MKLSETTHTLELSGIDKKDVNHAYIECNSAILDVLSNKIYKNKLGSLVREILSNAKDASIEASTQVPVKIHLPTIIEPFFAIQDFGIGMTKETIKDVFANFGKSSKTHTNDLIGMYGLGAKTAGIYGNQYTVTSTKGKIKSVFQFFKDSSGKPCNVMLDSSPTEEPDGTEIKIPVNNTSDFKKFEEEVSYYCRWLDYPVELNKSLNIDKPEFDHQEESFSLTKWSQKGPIIVIGGVPYSVNFYDSKVQSYYGIGVHGVKENHIVLHGKIGDVDFIGSREETEYTEKTIKFIQSAVEKIKDFYKKYLVDKTQVWAVQNRKDWEHNQDKKIRYGFNLKIKFYSKWQTRSESEKVFAKYVLVDDITKKKPWCSMCKRVKELVDYVAFVNESDKDALIAIGVDPSTIIDYSKLPKQKIGKLKKYKVMTIIDDKVRTKRVDELEDDYFYVKNSSLTRTGKETIEKILEDTDEAISIIVDDNQPCGLKDYLKRAYGENLNVDYCNVVKNLEKLKIVKRLTVHKDDGYDRYRRDYGLMLGERVNLSTHFPLLENMDFGDYFYKLTPKIKEHALMYVDYVLKKVPDALKNKHLQVLST